MAPPNENVLMLRRQEKISRQALRGLVGASIVVAGASVAVSAACTASAGSAAASTGSAVASAAAMSTSAMEMDVVRACAESSVANAAKFNF